MIRRAVFASAVLIGTIFWADCGFEGKNTPPEDPAWNGFFAGCFQGPVTDPAGFGEVTIVLEARPDDKLMLGGCQRLTMSARTENGTLSGMVLDANRQQADVMVTPSTGPIYTLRVERTPTGNVAATAVSLSNQSGAPFTGAPNLMKSCTMTCPLMGIRMPFLPGGGAP